MTNGVQRSDTLWRKQMSGLRTISGGMRGHAFGCGSRRAAITSVMFATAVLWPLAGYATPLLPIQTQPAQPAPEPAAAPAQTNDTKVTASATWTRRGGMVRYDRPVFHNGRRVLWHGAWRDGGRGAEAAARARLARPQAAPTPPTPERDLIVLVDTADASATRMAAEFAQAMESDGLRIKPVAGKTSIAGLDKAVTSDAADLAIVPMDALGDSGGGADKIAEWRDRAPFLARLANEPIALIAPRAIADIHQLAGRKVNVGAADGATAASAGIVFSRLNIAPTMTNEPLPDALSHLARGEIDAVFLVGAGSGDSKAVADFGKDGRFHIVAIPYAPALQALYCPMRLTQRDEANLIGADDKVDTIGVPTALLAIDAAQDSPRAGRLAPLIDRLFAQFDQSVGSLRSSHWKDVNLAARIGGWPRFGASQAWLDQNRGAADPALETFRGGAETAASASEGPSGADSDKLYESLMKLSGAAQ